VNPTLLVEPGAGAQAALEALRRRMRGERFDCIFAVPDDRVLIATALLPAFLPQAKTYDERCVVLDMLADRKLVANGTPQAELSGVAPDDRVAMRECGYLADRIRVTSWAEAERLAAFLGLPPDQFERFAPAPASIVLPATYRRGSMVFVYAPGVPAALTAIIVHALEGRAGGTIVYGDRSLCAGTSAEFVTDPARALATAAAVVVASATDPSIACALAALGAPLAISSTSGAREYLENVAIFEPWDRSSILAAVSDAIGASAPILRNIPELPEPAPDPVAPTQPLVSIVVRTKDRVRFLTRALASCAAQTYRNLEVVIVNDGGAAIDAALPLFPAARVIVHPTSLGAGKTLADGMAATTGTYVMELDDDDVIFPDHVERLVNILETSGAGAVNAMAVSIHGEPRGDGGYDLVGMGTFLRKTNRRDRIPVEDGIGPMATLFRRSALYAAGGPDPEITHADDWMMLARISQRCDVLHLRAVTAAYTIRNDFSSMMTTRGAELIASLERMAADLPLADRPVLARERAAMIERTRATGGIATFPAAAVRFAGGPLL
jgi:hypothetical protein